jgi:hypothetical protein
MKERKIKAYIGTIIIIQKEKYSKYVSLFGRQELNDMFRHIFVKAKLSSNQRFHSNQKKRHLIIIQKIWK